MTGSKILAADLDDLDPLNRPIFVTSKDLHFAWCNTTALAELGVTSTTPDPSDGSIARDSTGTPTGLLIEAAAIALIWPYQGRVTTPKGGPSQ